MSGKKKNGRNDPCTCGSGVKYKKCCFMKPVQGCVRYYPRRSRGDKRGLFALLALGAAMGTSRLYD